MCDDKDNLYLPDKDYPYRHTCGHDRSRCERNQNSGSFHLVTLDPERNY